MWSWLFGAKKGTDEDTSSKPQPEAVVQDTMEPRNSESSTSEDEERERQKKRTKRAQEILSIAHLVIILCILKHKRHVRTRDSSTSESEYEAGKLKKIRMNSE